MERIQVVFIDLPPGTNGTTVKMFDDGEDCFTIVLNSRLNWEQQRETYLHELKHIGCHDFDVVEVSVDTVEWVRHLAL